MDLQRYQIDQDN